jgi:signal transduction histidine kinase
MPSQRTDTDRYDRGTRRLTLPQGMPAFFQRLNTRLVMAIAAVALVGLVVSGFAITQILPGYFADQTEQRLRSAAISIGFLLREAVADARVGDALVDELRDRRIVQAVAEQAVRARLANATVELRRDNGLRAARAIPSEEDIASLENQGLSLDPAVEPVEEPVPVELPDGRIVIYAVVLTDPYTARSSTLAQIQSAIIGAGLLALVVATIVGFLASRRVAAPISRLRRVAGRVARGELDERASASGVLEIDELAQQFNVMADRLAGTLRTLEADRDRLREFVADVSHELRTPIAALRMYNELQRDGGVDAETRTEFLDRSAEQIRRLEWMSTNLLDLSRIDAGIFPLDMRSGDLRDPIRAVVEAHAGAAEERGISLESRVPVHGVEIRFDRERMVQLLDNLVENALKFTPRGGEVELTLEETREGAIVEVRDTGPGIPEAELPRIFERFYRGTNTGEARASGSGLGLAIVRSIVEMHGGTIDVASVVGEGTDFRITLTRAASEAAAAAQPSQPEMLPSGAPTTVFRMEEGS